MSIKPSKREIAVTQIAAKCMVELDEMLLRHTRTCLNCRHFDEPNEACMKYDNQRPPARIIALGCDGHEDTVPF